MRAPPVLQQVALFHTADVFLISCFVSVSQVLFIPSHNEVMKRRSDGAEEPIRLCLQSCSTLKVDGTDCLTEMERHVGRHLGVRRRRKEEAARSSSVGF